MVVEPPGVREIIIQIDEREIMSQIVLTTPERKFSETSDSVKSSNSTTVTSDSTI